MESLLIPLLLALFVALAARYGHDSGPHLRSQEEDLARTGFAVDNETLSVYPDSSRAGVDPPSQVEPRTRVGGWTINRAA